MQFRDLQTQYQEHKTQIDEAIQKVLDSSRYIGGPEVNALEEELAEYVGRKHCVTCANGTDAMELILMAWGIGPGDAVYVPDFTFFSTAEVVASVGATPVFVDVKEETFNIDPESLEEAIKIINEEGKLKSKAVIPVDLFGLPADYPALLPIAEKYGIKVLEDGAQGFGGHIEIDGEIKRACSFGDASTTSFFPAKPLGCYGDGGAMFTDDDEVADLLKSLKVHGKGTHKYENVRVGRNSRLDSIQAAILRVKLDFFIKEELDSVQRVYETYHKLLSELIEKESLNIKLPIIPENYYSSFAQYTTIIESEEKRDALQAKLKEKDIPTMVYYPKPLSKQEAFTDACELPVSLDVTERLCKMVLSLPMHPYLTKEDMVNIVSEFIEGIK